MRAERKAKHFVTEVSSSGGRHVSTADALEQHIAISRKREGNTRIDVPSSKTIGAAQVTVTRRPRS